MRGMESILREEFNLLRGVISSSSINLTKEDFDMLFDYYEDFFDFLSEIVSLPKNTKILDNLILHPK